MARKRNAIDSIIDRVSALLYENRGTYPYTSYITVSKAIRTILDKNKDLGAAVAFIKEHGYGDATDSTCNTLTIILAHAVTEAYKADKSIFRDAPEAHPSPEKIAAIEVAIEAKLQEILTNVSLENAITKDKQSQYNRNLELLNLQRDATNYLKTLTDVEWEITPYQGQEGKFFCTNKGVNSSQRSRIDFLVEEQVLRPFENQVQNKFVINEQGINRLNSLRFFESDRREDGVKAVPILNGLTDAEWQWDGLRLITKTDGNSRISAELESLLRNLAASGIIKYSMPEQGFIQLTYLDFEQLEHFQRKKLATPQATIGSAKPPDLQRAAIALKTLTNLDWKVGIPREEENEAIYFEGNVSPAAHARIAYLLTAAGTRVKMKTSPQSLLVVDGFNSENLTKLAENEPERRKQGKMAVPILNELTGAEWEWDGLRLKLEATQEEYRKKVGSIYNKLEELSTAGVLSYDIQDGHSNTYTVHILELNFETLKKHHAETAGKSPPVNATTPQNNEKEPSRIATAFKNPTVNLIGFVVSGIAAFWAFVSGKKRETEHGQEEPEDNSRTWKFIGGTAFAGLALYGGYRALTLPNKEGNRWIDSIKNDNGWFKGKG